MILLRYGIRCSLHYSVPLTLGLIAYTGSWQGVARNLMSETKAAGKAGVPDENATKVADGKAATDKQLTDSPNRDRPEGESIAMNPEGSDSSRSLTIPRADNRRNREPAPDSVSNGSARSRGDSSNPPRDRDIDATGHDAQSETDRSGPSLSASMAAGAAGLAFAAVNPQHEPPVRLAANATAPDKVIENSPVPVSDPASMATSQAGEKTETPTTGSVAKESDAAAKPMATQTARSDSAGEVSPTAEPAHLNPKIRAIAAEVPSAAAIAQSASLAPSTPAETPVPQAANMANETAKPSTSEVVRQKSAVQEGPAVTPAVLASTAPKTMDPDVPESRQVVAKSDPKPQNSMPATIDRKNVEVPDVVIAQEGETWNRIAARIYGDEKMAETIWRENRDAHGGNSDALPIAGRMVRLPEAGKSHAIPNSGQTQLARTAR